MDEAPKSNNIRQRAYQFSIAIIEFIDQLPYDVSSAVISKQLVRSATSVGANLMEAKGASSRRDFSNFYTHALKSANETIYWLGLLRDAKKIDNEKMNMLIGEAKEISKMIGSCIVRLKNQACENKKHNQFSEV